MMVYADYSYYKGVWQGSQISAERFGPIARRASEYIDYVTLGRAQAQAEETGDDKIKDACCALAEKFYVIENAANAAAGDGIVESETVGPHSVHYVSPVEISQSAQAELYFIAQRYLWPYMYRGVPMV